MAFLEERIKEFKEKLSQINNQETTLNKSRKDNLFIKDSYFNTIKEETVNSFNSVEDLTDLVKKALIRFSKNFKRLKKDKEFTNYLIEQPRPKRIGDFFFNSR